MSSKFTDWGIRAFFSRVEAIMGTCRDLETEIENSRTHAADLLQAVLKEAFSQS